MEWILETNSITSFASHAQPRRRTYLSNSHLQRLKVVEFPLEQLENPLMDTLANLPASARPELEVKPT